jgi:hypothetical protein
MKTNLTTLSISLLALAAGPCWALGQSTTANGAAFSSACAGVGFSYTGSAGNAINGGISDVSMSCDAKTSAIGATVATGAAKSGVIAVGAVNTPYADTATGSAGQQFIKLDANNSGSTWTHFSGAQVNGGWNESLTLTAPGKSGTGIYMAPVLVNGQLTANGIGALGSVSLEAYQNHAVLTPYGDALHSQASAAFLAANTTHNGPIGSSWDYQAVRWQVSDYGPGSSLTLQSMTVNTTVWFALPFTYGVAFDLGIYAIAAAGETASGGYVHDLNTADISFGHTFAWGGKGYVLAGAQHLTDFNLSSGSGLSYDHAYTAAVPEPASTALMLAGLGLFCLRGRRWVGGRH